MANKNQTGNFRQEPTNRAIKEELDRVTAGQQQLLALLSELKPTTELIRETQVEIAGISKDTNKEAHLAKHGVFAFPANMQGFTNITEAHYDRISNALSEFRGNLQEIREHNKYFDEITAILVADNKNLKDTVTITQLRELIIEVSLLKQRKSNHNYLWWIIGAIGLVAAMITGVIVAVKNIKSLLFIADSVNSLFQ